MNVLKGPTSVGLADVEIYEATCNNCTVNVDCASECPFGVGA